MSTQSTTNNSRTGGRVWQQQRVNYTAVQWSNNFGAISLGKVHKKGDVISSIMMQAVDGRHKFYMDSDGQRPGYTQLTAPGAVAIRCGPDLDAEQDAIILAAGQWRH